jgi:hypothetical protein
LDLALYGRVLRRFWYIAVVGVLLAIQLSFFSYYKVESGGITTRAAETWEAEETLMLTERGFPIGRSSATIVVPETTTGDSTTPALPVVVSPTDALRYGSLAPVYAALASSDAVRSLATTRGLEPGTSFIGSAGTFQRVGAGRQQLPFVTITAAAPTADSAVRAARAGSAAFQEYVKLRQASAGIGKSHIVLLQVTNEAKRAALVEGPSLTIPIGVLLTVLATTIALIFILENLKRRSRSVRASGQRRPTPAVAASDAALRASRVETMESDAPPSETSVAAQTR